jgi:hypothetical protein
VKHYSPAKDRGIDWIGFGDGGQVWSDNRSAAAPANFASRNWKVGVGSAIQYRRNKSLTIRFDLACSQDRTLAYFSFSRGF